MTMAFYRLMGQILMATQTWESLPDVREAMSKAGLTKDQVEQGKALVQAGEKLIERRELEGGSDRSAWHSLHQAVAELEMWSQTTAYVLASRVDDEEVQKRAVHHGVHGADHTVTAVASAYRMLGVLRTDERVGAAIKPRSLHDRVLRGKTLLTKVGESGGYYVTDRSRGHRLAVFTEIKDLCVKMQRWVEELAQAAAKVEGRPEILGLLGYVPDEVGRPSGGASFGVPLHQRAKREAPDPNQPGSTSGWSVGRQGRNRENLGKGFVEPTFD